MTSRTAPRAPSRQPLGGILHGYLESGARNDEHTAWGHRYGESEPAAAVLRHRRMRP
ncbi:MAG: hypothetical protein ACTHPS_22765 [Streptosporangiaceae bacterium]